MENHQSIAQIRRVYQSQSLREEDVQPNALDQFESWWQQAIDSRIEEPNAMVLSTCGEDGMPSARVVLLKGLLPNGFIFFTNYLSHKGKQIAHNPRVSLLFFWQPLERQIRIEGVAAEIAAQESDKYFASRPRESQIGAWSSPQSQAIASRQELELWEQKFMQKYANKIIPRPPHWGGYLVKPTTIEFWQGRPGRLHDRILYEKTGDVWTIRRLAP